MQTYQSLIDNPLPPDQQREARIAAIRAVEDYTGRPLVVYAGKLDAPPEAPNSINLDDVLGFSDLIHGLVGPNLDVLIDSPGGSPEAAERVVRLLRERFSSIRFMVPLSAYSAATMIALSGNKILMDDRSSLGPIDPQVNGIPARSILDGFTEVRKILKKEGPQALPAYIPLISKYDLHIFEICKNYEKLSRELCVAWLNQYMFEGKAKKKAQRIARHFADYRKHKTHSRSIGIAEAQRLELEILDMRQEPELQARVWQLSLRIQQFWLSTQFVKLIENSRGISWGKQFATQTLSFPIFPFQGVPAVPQPAEPSTA